MKRHFFPAVLLALAMSVAVYATWPGAGYVDNLRARWADTPDDARIPLGQHDHFSSWHLAGSNAGVVSTVETVWTAGGAYNWISTAAQMKISSSATADDAGSTGALTLAIYGLDATYALATETVTMDGRTQVTSANTYVRINKVRCLTAGTGTTNAGDIYVYTGAATSGVPDVSTTVYAKVPAGEGTSSGCTFTVPEAHAGLVYFLSGSHDSGKRIMFTLEMRPTSSGCWQEIYRFENDAEHTVVPFRLPLVLDERADLRLRALNDASDSTTSDAHGSIHLTLINEDLYVDAKGQ